MPFTLASLFALIDILTRYKQDWDTHSILIVYFEEYFGTKNIWIFKYQLSNKECHSIFNPLTRKESSGTIIWWFGMRKGGYQALSWWCHGIWLNAPDDAIQKLFFYHIHCIYQYSL